MNVLIVDDDFVGRELLKGFMEALNLGFCELDHIMIV